MKKYKFITFSLLLIIFVNLTAFTNDNKSQNNKKKFNYIKYLYKEKAANSNIKISYYGTKSTALFGLGIAGISIFGISCFSYFAAAIATSGINLALYGTGTHSTALIVIMASGFIPIAGPWVGLGFLAYMANTPDLTINQNLTNPTAFYGSLIALYAVLGTLELAGFAILLIGFISFSSLINNKDKEVSFFISNNEKGDFITGLRYSF